MNLRTLDLNLLLVFDAIYGERSISKAALKLHLSQPTVSNALARLRERLGDPLFERQGQGMRPTPRAKKLAEPIRQALHTLERGLRDDDTFDFAHSEREFVIAVEDYGESVILPGFVRWLSEVAPRIRIHIRTDGGAPLRAELREGQVDLALDYCEEVPRLPTELVQRAIELFQAAGFSARASSVHINAWHGVFDKGPTALQLLEDLYDDTPLADPGR